MGKEERGKEGIFITKLENRIEKLMENEAKGNSEGVIGGTGERRKLE